MAELLLTEKERNTKLWSDLDDEALGKVTKSYIYKIKNTIEQEKRIFTMATAMALCVIASEANADTMKISVDGITNNGKSIGNWKVTAKRFSKSTTKEEK